MALLKCPNCGQTYNPGYMRYCARCGEAVPDEHGKLPKRGPMDGLGARGGAATPASQASVPTAHGPQRPSAEPWQPPKAVDDMVLEYRNRLNQSPEDHTTRFSLALAYLLAKQWAKAEEHFALVVEALPEYADAHYRLALCRAKLGKLDSALQAAQTAVGLSPDNRQYVALEQRISVAIEDGS